MKCGTMTSLRKYRRNYFHTTKTTHRMNRIASLIDRMVADKRLVVRSPHDHAPQGGFPRAIRVACVEEVKLSGYEVFMLGCHKVVFKNI